MKLKFSCEYNELLTKLKDVSIVAEDALSNEDLKNIIFRFERGEDKVRVKLVGVNQLITYRRAIEDDKYSVVIEDDTSGNDVFYLQIKSKELISFLDSYKSVRKTHVEEVTFENDGTTLIRCSVLERDNDTGNPHISGWSFSNIGIKPNMIGNIELKNNSTELTCVPCRNILVHTRNLSPIMQNGTNLYSNLQMDSEYVVAFNQAYTVLMRNVMALDGVLAGLKLSFRAVSFMDKIICNDPINDDEHSTFNEATGFDEPYDYVNISKTETHLYFQTKSGEAFIIYDTKLADYQTAAKMFVKEHAIVIDRIYLKDILKRLSLVNDMVEFYIQPSDGVVKLSNSKYSQDIPILQSKGLDSIGSVGFKIMPDILSKAIIGDDNEFSESTFVYYCPQPNGSAIIAFADDSGSWFSIVRVNTH